VNSLVQGFTAIASPTTPGASRFYLYAKSDGLYFKDSTGKEVGPLGAYDPRLTAIGTTVSGSTITLIETPVVAEDKAYAIDGFVFGWQGNYNNTHLFRFHAVFSRQAGANVEVNAQLINGNGSGTAPACVADVNIGTQTGRLRITGDTATWNWKAQYWLTPDA
jgi:hypothetical protein